MSERLILPVALWSSKAPTHRISCVHLMHNGKNLVTGSRDGQICIWDVEQEPLLSITPRCMVFGHSAAVSCMSDGDYINHNTLVTSSDNGEMSLWNVDDGQCLETKKTQYTHTFMQSFRISDNTKPKETKSNECRLFCVGHYAEILVIDPKTFAIRFRLTSRENPDWISTIHILQPPQLSNIVIIGLSINGIVRIWTITGETSRSLDPIYDNDRKELKDCRKSVQIISNPDSMRLILIVCPDHWRVYDATDFAELCSVEAPNNQHWSGGNFMTRDQVLVWNDKGEGFLYQVTTKRGADSRQPSATRLKAKLACKSDMKFLYPPKMCLTSTPSGNGETHIKLLLRGDSNGCITTWDLFHSLNNQDEVLNIGSKMQQSLENVWKSRSGETCEKSKLLISNNNNTNNNNTLHNHNQRDSMKNETQKVTTSIYIPGLSRLACGRDDGSIIITTLSQLAISRLQSGPEPQTNIVNHKESVVLKGHTGRISCLLYPNATNPRYDFKFLLSGGADFGVCLWEMGSSLLLHKFRIHAGAITQLLVPPNDCSKSLQSSICCVASDHSVSILNLNERKCTLLASRHLFPVKQIKWKPSEESMVVSCSDGSVYIWRIDTGHLVKVLQGIYAEDTLASCDESFVTKEDPTNPALELFKGLKQGNISAIKSAAAKGLNQLATQHAQAKVDIAASYRSHPLIIQNLRANPSDDDAYVLFFDIESIITYLLHEPNLVTETVSILLSILKAWGLSEEAKKICINNPELLKDFKPACIGLLSKSCYMSLLLPSHVRKWDSNIRRSKFFYNNFSLARLTGHCLSQLLFVPSSTTLPLYTTLRYTAVGLIGRGFTFWEPYLDVAKVLLGLLDLSSDSEAPNVSISTNNTKNNNNNNLNMESKLIPPSRQAAREALTAIALARPSVFITTLAREIAKFYNKQSGPSLKGSNIGNQPVTPILIKSKQEILRNISVIIDQMPLEVSNLMVETMDLTLHCIDHSLLENRGLNEAYPALNPFYMISYCSASRRIAVGTVSGNLAMYELRAQAKPQIVPAHKSPLTACSFSPDGKYLATYSAGDNKLCFWLTATGLFGLGNARTRCVGSIDTPPVAAESILKPEDHLKVARLIWVAAKIVILMFSDDREFRYQVAS